MTKTNSSKQSQADKFREAAKEAEADDDEKRFDERVKRLARQAPKKDSAPDSQN